MGKHKTLINNALIYFSLTFVIGYLDFDRRVYDFERSTYEMERVALGNSHPPLASRILVPFTMHFIHRISHIPLTHIYAFFRFLSFFLAFFLFHTYLKKWFDDKLAMIGTLFMIASLPLFLTNWYSLWPDMTNLIAFILGTMWIKDNKCKLLYILVPVATLNKEAIIAVVLLYFLYNVGKENTAILIRRTVILSMLWAVTYAFTLFAFGFQTFMDSGDPWFLTVTIKHNLAGLLQIFKNPNPYNHYYFIIYLFGFFWVLAFRNFRNKDPLLRKSVIVMGLYFLYVFLRAGAINEVRVFIPFYVYIIPLGLSSLFNGDRSHREGITA